MDGAAYTCTSYLHASKIEFVQVVNANQTRIVVTCLGLGRSQADPKPLPVLFEGLLCGGVAATELPHELPDASAQPDVPARRHRESRV